MQLNIPKFVVFWVVIQKSEDLWEMGLLVPMSYGLQVERNSRKESLAGLREGGWHSHGLVKGCESCVPSGL
jgi:hypothetical protein